ncbi:hypothetical protein CBM2595_A80044 [Cupriavidus taiwanensis]|nr:hypothetical protein CBM2595_A80044 [Cupriavidus taiwanensis]
MIISRQSNKRNNGSKYANIVQ